MELSNTQDRIVAPEETVRPIFPVEARPRNSALEVDGRRFFYGMAVGSLLGLAGWVLLLAADRIDLPESMAFASLRAWLGLALTPYFVSLGLTAIFFQGRAYAGRRPAREKTLSVGTLAVFLFALIVSSALAPSLFRFGPPQTESSLYLKGELGAAPANAEEEDEGNYSAQPVRHRLRRRR